MKGKLCRFDRLMLAVTFAEAGVADLVLEPAKKQAEAFSCGAGERRFEGRKMAECGSASRGRA